MNRRHPFQRELLEKQLPSIDEIQSIVQKYKAVTDVTTKEIHQIISLIDLTSLNSTDTADDIEKLCSQALSPIQGNNISVAAVCVYPVFIEQAKKILDKKVNIATVDASFPHGLAHIDTRAKEIEKNVSQGANEIDIVIRREWVLTGKFDRLYNDIKILREASRGAHLKVILSTGELEKPELIYQTSITAMLAGADFIKTSTGKEKINATLEAGWVMCQAIKDFKEKLGVQVGLKPAGGIRSIDDALSWLNLIKSNLGEQYLSPKTFRFGASQLLQEVKGLQESLVSN